MFNLLLACIKLYVINLCACNIIDKKCSQDLNSDKILLQNNSHFSGLNYELMDTCGHIYDFVIEKEYQVSGVRGMIDAGNTYKNVINLGVNDYYNFNLHYTLQKGLVHAGELPFTSQNKVCAVDNGTDTRECSLNYVKMVSNNVTEIDGGHLYNYITNIKYVNWKFSFPFLCPGEVDNSLLDIVLVCSDTEIDTTKFSNQFCPLKFRYSNCNHDDIKKYKNKLLAILTSRPFPIEYEINVPVMFYETPFSYEENLLEMFPNSVMTGWQMLKYPIMKFLEQMDWRKVAIITDDSAYSVEFEEELTELFRSQVVMYTVKRCEDRTSCDSFFKNVLKRVRDEGTRVIIANFRDQYINYFKTQKYGWIMRDLPSDGKWSEIGDGYSVTMAPTGHDTTVYSQLGLNPQLDQNTKIVENIKHIYKAYHEMGSQNNINNINRNEFYRQLANKLKKYVKTMDYVSHVYDENSRRVGNFKVTPEETTVSLFTPTAMIKDVSNCPFRSNNYFSPCNDTEFILIMSVITVFSITLLLIIIYFQKASPVHASRYVSF